jgi:hypothetical protein
VSSVDTSVAKFTDLGEHGAQVYFDDLICHTSTWEDHLALLRRVFQRLRESFLHVKAAKTRIGFTEVKFLGHLITNGTISPLPDRVEAMRKMPAPHNLDTLRSFLGMAGYYRNHIRTFLEHARHLYPLTRKGVSWEWTPQCQKAFDALKEALSGYTLLYAPDMTQAFILQTDASSYGIKQSANIFGIRQHF